MLAARTVAKNAIRCPAPRCAAASAALKHTTAKAGAVALPTAPTHEQLLATEFAVSRGELAWCEIYGVDYDQQMRVALDESPIAVNERAVASSTTAATASGPSAQQDIWTVVFGTK